MLDYAPTPGQALFKDFLKMPMCAAPTESEIHQACEQVAVGYAKASDRGDADAAAEFFVVDGVLEMPGGRSFSGRSAVRQRLLTQPAEQVSRHLLSNFTTRLLAAGHVAGHCYVTMYRATRDAPGALPLAGPYLIGEYDDEYRLTLDGWQISRRRLTTVFRRQDG